MIPVKNDAVHLRKLLTSCKNQTLKPAQIIVASSSTDNSNKIARSFGARVVPGIVDGRIGRARNLGAKLAKSPLLIFIDADVYFQLDFFANVIQEFEKRELDLATCRISPSEKSAKMKIIFYLVGLEARVGAKINYVTNAAGMFMIFKNSVFEKIHGFNEEFKVCEDIDAVNRARKLGYRYGVLNQWITASARRYENRNFLGLIKLLLATIGIFFMTKYGWFKKHQNRFVRWYGPTGGGYL